jgi:cytochrome c553
MFPKDSAFRSEKWLRAVASLHCMRCFREGMTQAAHRNEGKSMALKTDDCWTAALCVACHSEIDQGNGMSKQERRDAMDTAILMTLRELARTGLVTA